MSKGASKTAKQDATHSTKSTSQKGKKTQWDLDRKKLTGQGTHKQVKGLERHAGAEEQPGREEREQEAT